MNDTQRRPERNRSTLSVELYARPSTPAPDRRDAVIGRLETLRADGRIGGLDVTQWPAEVPLSGTVPTPAVERFEAFGRWADRARVSITPPFTVRRGSSLVGDPADVLRTPVLCLAARRGSRLAGVFPCSRGERVYSVGDAVDAIGAGTLPVAPGPVPASPGGRA